MTPIRSLEPADLSAVSARLRAEYPTIACDEANLHRKTFADPDYRPELCLGAFDGPRPVAVLLGVVRGQRGYVKALTVTPDTGLAERLLTEYLERAKALGATEVMVANSAPSYFQPGVDPTDTVTVRFYLERGFTKVHETYNMVCDLLEQPLETAEDEARLAAGGLHCARLQPVDREELSRFMREHFSAGWLTETLVAYEVDPVTCHVAWRDGRIVAFAAAEVTNPGWFGPMGTAPDQRGGGLGRVLLLRCLRDLRQLGYRQATIGWVGPLGFYARWCRALVSQVFWVLRREL